jgi:hypothetical protein
MPTRPQVQEPTNGSIREIDGKVCVYYDGYWIRYYAPPEDTLAEKQALMDSLTRRTFHHTERGINTPGERLDAAREAWERESDPDKKRVNAAMLAGALFNRASDIFSAVVALASKGVLVSHQNELMNQCAECFREALELGRQVRHYSGAECVDEIWGEPFKAFTMPMEAFYESRYLKIAMAMRDIDRVSARLVEVFGRQPAFSGIEARIAAIAAAAKTACETMRSDPAIFEAWPAFVAAADRLAQFEPQASEQTPLHEARRAREGVPLLQDARNLYTYLTEARAPLPNMLKKFLGRVDRYEAGDRAQ